MLYIYIIMLTFNNYYSEALGIDPFNRTTNSKLYFNRATVHAKPGKLENSIDDCSKAIDLDNTYIKAYLRLIFYFIFHVFLKKKKFSFCTNSPPPPKKKKKNSFHLYDTQKQQSPIV